MLPELCFVTSHPNPASHFEKFICLYEEYGFQCKVITDKNVCGKFAQIKSKVVVIDPSNTETEQLLNAIEKEIASQSIVITDIANEIWVSLHKMLSEKHPAIKRAVYYDNPERYVPGSYSELAAKIIDKIEIILFANASLVQKGIESHEGVSIDLSKKSNFGIGYYPKIEATQILGIKQNPEKVKSIKKSLLEKNSIPDKNQKIYVYIGGANDVYYNKAFPHFLKLVSEVTKVYNSPLQNTIIVLQQHPRAKVEGNQDAKLVNKLPSSCNLPEGFSFFVSDLPTSEALSIADGVFYYQTSMSAQFVFAGIPSVIQVGHDTYSDVLIRAGFPSVTDCENLIQALSSNAANANLQDLERQLGMDPDWMKNLLKITEY